MFRRLREARRILQAKEMTTDEQLASNVQKCHEALQDAVREAEDAGLTLYATGTSRVVYGYLANGSVSR